jgi:dipeptidyl aminopeptidase/acylaminoacyl peptidase
VVYWASEVGTTDGGWLWMRRAKGVRPWNDASWYKQQSPWTYVENMRTPMLLEVQEGDLRCPIEQGQMLYTAVKFLNKAPIRFVRYPNGFHGMSRNGQPWHRVHRHEQIVQWLQKYL